MHKIIGAIALVVGVFLLIRGHDVSHSLNGQFQNVANQITGSSNDKVVYYYVGGAICCAVGLVELFRPYKK